MPPPPALEKKTVTAVRVTTRGRKKGFTTGSLAEQIDRMGVGEAVSLAQRFALDDDETSAGEIKAALNNMRSQLCAYATRVAEMNAGLDDRVFKTESGTFVVDDKSAIVICVAMTRVA